MTIIYDADSRTEMSAHQIARWGTERWLVRTIDESKCFLRSQKDMPDVQSRDSRKRNSNRSSTVLRALRALEIVAHRDEAIGATELGEFLEVDRVTAHRVLATLFDGGFLRKSTKSGKYRASLRLLSLTRKLAEDEQRSLIIREGLERIVKATGESCSYEMLEGHEVIVVKRVEGNAPDRIQLEIGMASPAACTSIGKAILAFQDPRHASRVFREGESELSDSMIADEAKFMKELDRVKSRRFAADDLTFQGDVRSVAAPLFETNYFCFSGLAICGPASRFTKDYIQQLGNELVFESDRIFEEFTQRIT